MDSARDHFALLGLPRSFAVDVTELERRYRELQSEVHPDKHAHLGDAARRAAMQAATQVNEAYRTLKDPLSRARYLLQLAGKDPEIERNTAMPTEFLIEQMELREAVAEARGGGASEVLDELHGRIKRAMAGEYRSLQQALDEVRDYGQAAETVRRLMFQEKLLHDIDEALEAIEA